MAITIRSNKREYSKYSDGLGLADLTVAGASAATDYQIALVRDDGFGDVAVRAITATVASFGVLLDLEGESADSSLGELAATREGINYANQGMYHAEIRDAFGGLLARSSSFPVSVMPVEEFKRSYLFGVPLWAEEVMHVARQPRAITGAEVTYIDPAMLKGAGVLAYDATAHTFTWRGGPAVAVDTSVDEVQTIQLLTPEADAYMELEIDPFVLPATNTSDSLVVDNWRMTDADLRRYLWQAYDWTQQQLRIRLETTIVTTDPATYAGYFDETAQPVSFERYHNRTIELGSAKTKPLRKVIALAGYYVDTKAIDIPREWMTIEQKAAIVELVPISGSALLTPIAAAWGLNMNLFRPARAVQAFWHFTVIAGLRTLDGERYSVREAIAKKAAMNVLTDLSLGATGGRMSRNASREGVSESWSYGSQGAYGEKVLQYSDWLKTYLPKLRQYYGGIDVVTL